MIFSLPRVAFGECVAPPSCCKAYDQAALVFLGDVESMQPESGPMRSGVVTQVRFRAVEWFKGTARSHVELALGPSSEEYPYVRGERVLVYANRVGETWSTACTRTRRVSPTDLELQVVRAYRDKESGGVIDGSVATAELLRTNRAGGIAVVVRRDGAVVSELRTDVAGRFQTGWLAPGVYELSIKTSTPAAGKPHKVVVSRDSGCLSMTRSLNNP